MQLLVTMGDWEGPGIGQIVRIDLARQSAELVFTWLPPEPLRAKSKGFTGIAWSGAAGASELIVCAHAALCRVDPQTWTKTGVLHQPCMNDLHGMIVHDGRILFANTGLDRVEVLSLAGRFLGGWDLSPGWVTAARVSGANPSEAGWRRALEPGWTEPPPPLDHEPFAANFDPLVCPSLGFSVRKMRDFVHPTHVAIVEGRPVVTRFLDRSIQDLTDFSLLVSELPGHAHDGTPFNDRFFITCVQGLIVGYEIHRGRITAREVERIDIYERTGCSGWCRGLLITEDLFVVTLSRIFTPPRYRFSDRPFADTETSVVALHRKTGQLAARVDLGRFGKAAKAFGLLPFPSTS